MREGLIKEGAARTLPVIPTQPISSLYALLIVGLVLLWQKKFQKKEGELILATGMFYAVARFLIEFVRGDNKPIYPLGTTVSQFVGIFLFAGCLAILLFRRFWKSAAVATVPPPVPAKKGKQNKKKGKRENRRKKKRRENLINQ